MSTLTPTFWGTDCIILSRVSTDKQDYTPQTTDLQNYAKTLGYTNFKTIETKESGFRTFKHKEGFKQVVDFITEYPTYQTIFITELSRLGRNRKVITDIEYFLKEKKIQLIVKDSNLKLFDDFGNIILQNQLMFSIYAALAESEMQQKKDRFIRAKKKLFAEGISVTGNPLFGYNRIINKTINKNVYIINEEQASEIKAIYNWYLNGIDGDKSNCSVSKITKECIKRGLSSFLHSKRNVNRVLKEQAYTGFKITNNRRKNPEYWVYFEKDKPKYINSTSMEIKYPVIISNDLYIAVQNRLIDNNSRVDKSTKHTTILSKIIICPECNHYFRGEYRIKEGGINHFYRCSHSKQVINPCKNKSALSMLQIDSAIWCFIKANISNLIEQITKYYDSVNIEDIQSIIDNLKNKISECEDEKATENTIFRTNIKRASDKERVTLDYTNRINLIDDKITEYQNEIEKQKEIISDIELNREKNLKEEISNKINSIENSKGELRKYIRLLIKKIIPLHCDRQYTVLKLVSIENVGYNFDYLKLDNEGLPTLKSNIANIEYYLLIDKSNTNRVKIKCIENPKVSFHNNLFKYGSLTYTLKNIFENGEWDIMDEPFLSQPTQKRKDLEENIIFFSVKDLEYVRFDNSLYKEDEIIK